MASISITDRFKRSMQIRDSLLSIVPNNKEIVFLCIGTDRNIGDTYGPLVGHMMSMIRGLNLFGTLNDPVAADNLKEHIDKINAFYKDHYVIAIDSMVGIYNHVGDVIVEKGPMRPGSGLNKDLPEVGDCSIGGIVTFKSIYSPLLMLNSTRLALVHTMAEYTTNGIRMFLREREKQRGETSNVVVMHDKAVASSISS